MYKVLKLTVCFLMAIASLSSTLRAEDWPTFRGSDRTGVSSETGLLDSWSKDGPKLLWSASGAGLGYASPAVADGRLYTLGDSPSTADKDEYLSCFSSADGKILWQTKVGPSWNEHREEHWNGARSTPTVSDDLVYVVTPHGKLVCAAVDDGKIVWEIDMMAEFGGKKKDIWGYSESPLVDGDLVLCTPGGSEATVVALNKGTGKLVWKCSHPQDVGAGHSSIVISHVGDQKVYVQNTGGGPIGFSWDGELLWTYSMKPPTAFIPTPIIKDEYVFTVAGYKLGGALIQQVAGADGSVSVKEIYGVKVELGNKHGGVILIGDYLYGGVEDQNIVYCAELLTGEVVWKARGSGANSTSVVAADGNLYVRFQNGVVALAPVDPTGYKEVSSFTTPGSGDSKKPSWAHPVIANGKLLLREGDLMLCYDISK